MVDITFNGMTMEFNVVADMMDENIKTRILAELGDSKEGEYSEQELLDAYMKAHKEIFGSDFLQSS